MHETNVETYAPVDGEPRRRRTLGIASWLCLAVGAAILVVGVSRQETWWMVSFPIAVAGAICGGRARRYVALVGNVLAASVLVLTFMTFAP